MYCDGRVNFMEPIEVVLWKNISSEKETDTMVAWAKEHCVSFKGMEWINISDFSSASYDDCLVFKFGESSDAVFFKLKWSDN